MEHCLPLNVDMSLASGTSPQFRFRRPIASMSRQGGRELKVINSGYATGTHVHSAAAGGVTTKSLQKGDGATWLGHLLAIASGNEAALAVFYAATSGRVYGYALRITRMPHCAAEVTVDVYLQVWRSAHSYDPTRACVMTWLLAICRNRAIDALRQRDPAIACPDPHSLLPEECVDAQYPELLALQAEQKREVQRAMETLAPVQRQLLTLAYYRGMTHLEIARHSGLPVGTVKSCLRNALQALRIALVPGMTKPLPRAKRRGACAGMDHIAMDSTMSGLATPTIA